jgi:RNA polymerase sigma-70 factor (ECF subfamily)
MDAERPVESERRGPGSGPIHAQAADDGAFCVSAECARAEREAIARARAGDTDAFGELVERYTPRIYTHLIRLTRNREEAEDLTQETFIKAFRFLASFDTTRSFRNWLYRIASNTGLNALRARRRRGQSVSLDASPLADDGATKDIARMDLRDRLSGAVSELAPQAAMLVHLHYHEGMTIREAGDIVGLSEGAAKVALHRARKRLRKLLIEDEEQ